MENIWPFTVEIMVNPPKWGTKHLSSLRLFLHDGTGILSIYYNVLARCKSWDLPCKVHVSDWILNPEWKTFGRHKVVFYYQIYLDELTSFSSQTIKGRTLCFSTNKIAVRVVL